MNVEKFFNGCVDIDPFDSECSKLLDKVMSVTSPMKFDADFASNEELDRLEAELDRFNIRSTESELLYQILRDLKAAQSSRFIFI